LRIVFDIECNALYNPTKIWVVVCKDIDTNEYFIFRNLTDEPKEAERFLQFFRGVRRCIGHNCLGYDLRWLRTLLTGFTFDIENVIDTLTISKLIDYSRKGHSIED
jgi:hypothetical protein